MVMFMKKIIYLLLLLLVGCSNHGQPKIVYNTSYYQVASEYKIAVGNYTLKSYDKNEVEKMLMYISTDYFSPNNSYYQEGQFLNNEVLKELVTKYNQTDILLKDNQTKPTFISTIYEQNYVASNNNLKGISLAVVLNKDQQYVENNITHTQIFDEKEVLDYTRNQIDDLIKYLRNIDELKDIKIVIGLYVESSNYLKGSFKYIGNTSKDSINLDYVNYNYKLLDSSEVLKDDLKNYNNFLSIKNHLQKYNLVIRPLALYKNNNLIKVNITINNNYLSRAKILEISDIISNDLNSFSSSVEVIVYFKSNNNTKGILVKNGLEVKIHLMEE